MDHQHLVTIHAAPGHLGQVTVYRNTGQYHAPTQTWPITLRKTVNSAQDLQLQPLTSHPHPSPPCSAFHYLQCPKRQPDP